MTGPAGSSADAFCFNAGRLCLDFTNTVRFRPVSERRDLISSHGDLLAWARQATIITPGEAASLDAMASERPREAAVALGLARTARESAYALFSAHAAGLPAPASELLTLNRIVGRAMARAGVAPAGGRFEWGWPGMEPDLDRVTWWVVRSSAELLTSMDLTFVRECASYDCGWLFLDTTRNRNRRWCDMRTCGNRAKSRRHYERRRAAGSDRQPVA
jgi:predicted RNA-binding Zn ribbon-like protein